MTNPDLAVILRRFFALVAASVLPAGALLLSVGRRELAVGLGFGALIGTLNAVMLARRINRSATVGGAGAQRVMQQGMGIRFSMILLASVVIVKATPATVPTFVLGLAVSMALAVAVAAQALLVAAKTAPDSAVGAEPRGRLYGDINVWRQPAIVAFARLRRSRHA